MNTADPTTSTEPQSQDSFSAVRWSVASKYGAQAVQFGVSMLLARLLSPEFFGLIGMATVIIGLARKLKNMGFTQAIIQRDDIDQRLLSTIFWVNLFLCGLISALLAAFSPEVASIYEDDQVSTIVSILSLNILIDSFGAVPGALLRRRMAFGKIAIRGNRKCDCVGNGRLGCALLGCGVWSLVASSLAFSLVGTVLINTAEPFWPSWVFDRIRLKECLKFGLNVTGYGIFSHFARNADNLIIGASLGPVALGYYSVAYRLMLLPRDTVTNVVTRVLLPKFSRIKDQDEQLASIFERSARAIAFLTFPMMIGLALVAEPFVAVFLGDKWLPAIPVIWVLAPIGAIESLWALSGQCLLAKGRADWFFYQGMARGLVLIAAFLIGVHWGITGVALAYGISCLAWTPIAFWLAIQHVTPLTPIRIVRALTPAAILTGLMAGMVVVGQNVLLGFGVGHAGILITSVFIGFTSYILLALFMRLPVLIDFIKIMPVTLNGRLLAWLTRSSQQDVAATQQIM